MGEIPDDIRVAAKRCAGEWNLIDAIALAILAERQRCAEVIAAAAALLDGTVTMEITPETDEKIQRLSMALHAVRHP
ncbi:hypothetical protein [Rhizobium laguerreae]|uniref:hypothetical protein n=1 Tax=Rhizobium laguerreae TaxID=1076926 RepID=UPI001C8FE6C0|nr:hypothetical protein [Rhizobium laguerreae]MBY3434787.1 hypothetical protein [Rhizobium laguerreae]MBY3448930.1 hypothetical protein [Rhizobium laguerreae]MBY3456704.1 hypothetical protein [Rhizobium laguerreae]